MTITNPPGIRNNNPGNIRRSGDKWQGLAKLQRDSRFFTFETPIYGIRAIVRLLINYQDKYLLHSIPELISRWAPPSENNTQAYIAAVVKRSGLSADQVLDMHRYEDVKPLVQAIIWQENGQQPYSDQQIDKALVLAGIEPQRKPIAQTRTIKGAQVVASTGAAAAASGIIAQAAPAIPVLSSLSEMARDNALGLLVALGVLVVAAAAYIAWARIDDRAKGIN